MANTIQVTDIFRRVKARSKLADNVTLFDKFDVTEGENLKMLHIKYMAAQIIFGL